MTNVLVFSSHCSLLITHYSLPPGSSFGSSSKGTNIFAAALSNVSSGGGIFGAASKSASSGLLSFLSDFTVSSRKYIQKDEKSVRIIDGYDRG